MKTASAIFIMGTLQVNRDNMSIFIQQKTLRIKRKVFYIVPHMPLSIDVHKPALTGGCSHKCL